jgi:citrate synthase
MTTNQMPTIDFNEIFSVDTDGGYTILYFKKSVNKLMIYDRGLYHTAICKSRLSKIDKHDGKLYYRGINVEEKLGEDFLDVAYEIIFGEIHDKKERFKKAVFSYFQLFPEQKALLDTISLSTNPMDILSIATIALSGIEKKYLTDPSDIAEKSGFILTQVAITVSYIYHRLNNTPWIKELFSSSSYAEQILVQMHNGQNLERLKKLGKILNTIMILHAEHGQNCSAATVRNIASAQGSIYTGVTSGMAAFNGSIHGGASQFVSAMYEELLESGLDVDSYVDRKIERRELLMGFGQRTYNRIQNCWDPRVETMYRILTDKSFDFPEVEKYKSVALKLIDRVVNDEFFKARNLTPNPDLFNCIFYKLFGAPREMNTVMLALSRIVGWIANFVEHTQDNYPLTRPCDIDM